MLFSLEKEKEQRSQKDQGECKKLKNRELREEKLKNKGVGKEKNRKRTEGRQVVYLQGEFILIHVAVRLGTSLLAGGGVECYA